MTVVFTAILGGSDSLKPAPEGVRAVCYTNDLEHANQKNGWELVWWPEPCWQLPDPRREAWRLRCLPHELFPDVDTTIWIDASFTLTDLPKLLKDSEGHAISALKHHTRHNCYEEGKEIIKVGQADESEVWAQLHKYQKEGFQPDFDLSISCVIVRKDSVKVRAFNELWDAEIQTHPGDNTQLSLDYAAWKTGLRVHHLRGVRKENPYAVHDHADHKKRRKPYR